jgi:hypothetical protein
VTVRVNPAGASYSRFPANAHVPLPRIAGHRDGDSTNCPGDVLYGELAGIRQGVRRLAARPVRATLALATPAPPAQPPAPPAAGEPAPAPGAAAPGALAGALQLLDGTPLAGARILLQARTVARKGEVVREQTIGEAVTGADGRWSLPATIAPARRRVALRVLFTGSSGVGAAVSEPLELAATVSLSAPVPAPAPTSPPSPPAAAPPAT